ncbi:hypothetical protein GZH47_08630 [Paenibacillus rhizovicinus]|uniref:Uncharacterized protein n=1 Tax=Paenibacillus rhizovicinus TaxID=2704463 RepID=A0A6C0P2M2_9BACL|nr:hypothetical protein [Paenibacillus rhizovicinus]QHW30912.1 hypothetical protein GZH47_08630 [Paenibacillus rhizovicinus]
MKLLLIGLLIWGFAAADSPPPLTITTVPAPEGSWVYLPDGAGSFIIRVHGTTATQINVWRVPTGTGQWVNRERICDYSGVITDWSCTWRYAKDDTIHDHFVVGLRFGDQWDMTAFNVTRRHDQDHPQ